MDKKVCKKARKREPFVTKRFQIVRIALTSVLLLIPVIF